GTEGINIIDRRQSTFECAVMVPLAAQEPLVARQLLMKCGYSLAKLFRTGRITQCNLIEPKSRSQNVCMAIVKAWHHSRAVGIKNLSARANQSTNVVGAANSQNPSLPTSNRLDLGPIAIHCPHFGVDQN